MSASTADTHRRRVPARIRRLAPWVGGLILIGGVAAAIVTFAPNRNAPPESAPQGPSPKPAPKPATVPLSAKATSVARRFIFTAVARKDLAAAWTLSGPTVRGGLTRAEWLTGAIPVVPYPVGQVQQIRFKTDYSYKNEALLEVALLPAAKTTKAQIFFIMLKLVKGPGGKSSWIVDNWVPRASALVPRAD